LQELSLLTGGEIGESLMVRGALESVNAISIDSRVTRKSFFQLLAAHAFDGISPKAVYNSNYAHKPEPVL
jgi:hypothetical protein